MYKKYVTQNGLEHGCINTLASSCSDTGFKHMTPEAKKQAEVQKKEEQKIVKVKYINARGPHERLEKPYLRWEGEPITMWRFLHDHDYEVPYGMVKEINEESLGLAKRSEILDVNGIPTKKDGAAEKIHRFYPVGF